jgi:thioredoxin 1
VDRTGAAVTERRTRQAIDLGGSTEFTDEGSGTVRAYFAALDVQGRGATEHDAFGAMVEHLGAILQTDEQAREAFGKWAETHTVEIELSAEEAAEQDEMAALLEAQSAHGVRELTADTFDQAIASDKPLLVDFWAAWCRPCLMAAPVLQEIHDGMAEVFDVAKVDVDGHPQIRERYGIGSIPCFILFRNGVEVDRIVGFAPKEQFRAAISDLLARA